MPLDNDWLMGDPTYQNSGQAGAHPTFFISLAAARDANLAMTP